MIAARDVKIRLRRCRSQGIKISIEIRRKWKVFRSKMIKSLFSPAGDPVKKSTGELCNLICLPPNRPVKPGIRHPHKAIMTQIKRLIIDNFDLVPFALKIRRQSIRL